MANHKRGKPKSSRAGCLLCNPQKRQGSPLEDRQRASQLRLMQAADAQIDLSRPWRLACDWR